MHRGPTPLIAMLLTLGVPLVALTAFLSPAASKRAALPEVRPNDNRRPAGRLDGDTLRIALVIQMARWHPEAEDGPFADVAAFGEEGGAPEIPGPLIRVQEGTVIEATVRNALADSAITVHGLATRPVGPADSLVIPPGARATARFAAGAPGTYLYWARVGVQDTMVEREQLAGALVVDGRGARTDDRVFVINIWGDEVDSNTYRNALTINGKSFPHTERVESEIGDTLRWRWINASQRVHPMHLHGFFFRVDARGDAAADTTYPAEARRMMVTEAMVPGSTMRIQWTPEEVGNWLFHCHLMFHALGGARLEPTDGREHLAHPGDMSRHMAGLVLPIAVRAPPGWRQPDRLSPHTVRLFVQEGKSRGRAARGLGYVQQRGARAPAPDSVEIPGGTLVLTRGVPTDVTVINRLPEPTAVHWHGLELESYSDGVPGWSGQGARLAPAIMPGDSFAARLTLKRAGTFIYHTHLNDFEQLTAGLYGPIVVLEPGERFDPTTDHVFVVGWDGQGEPPHLLVNGDSVSAPLTIAAGRSHRLRFVNIGMAITLRFSLFRDSTLQAWRPIARDGADLPPALSARGPAKLLLAVGQTADARFDPPAAGDYTLTMAPPEGPPIWSRRLVVR